MNKEEIPISQKLNLTLSEASVYSNIGESTLRMYIRQNPGVPFLLYVGSKALIKRKEFEEWNARTFIVR